MAATARREMLVTQLVSEDTRWPGGDVSPTYRMRIRLGCNWETYLITSYNPNDFAEERTDETPRLVELDDNTPTAVTIGNHIYKVITTS